MDEHRAARKFGAPGGVHEPLKPMKGGRPGWLEESVIGSDSFHSLGCAFGIIILSIAATPYCWVAGIRKVISTYKSIFEDP